MSTSFTGILWNKQKKQYDKWLWIGILAFMLTYIIAQLVLQPQITAETLIIRVTALTAIILLHLILAIGPLSRLNPLFLPLLYNRRHAGVTFFFLALIHGAFSIIQFHVGGDTNAFVSMFTSNARYQEISEFPFQTLGFFSLCIFAVMAITSHDFWLKHLSPKFWKTLHMGVYLAYGLIILHVATGAFQYESHPFNWSLLFIGFLSIASLHLIAGFKENANLKKERNADNLDGYFNIGPVDSIHDSRAKTVHLQNENIAVYRNETTFSAIHNVCKHQMGPLGEGKIIDGCITCPWHGYQYRPEDGQSPPPFTEKVKTYSVKVVDNHIWVNPTPFEEGTFVEPAKITAS